MKIRHILITTDLSEASYRPCAPVAALAAEHAARITMLHVVPDLQIVPHGAPLAPPISAPDLEERVKLARETVQREIGDLEWDVECSADVIAGAKIGETVAKYAREHDVDLIALSTHGHTGIRRLVLGSGAEEILRHAPVPVLAFPHTSREKGE